MRAREAARAATRSATGSPSPPPDRTSEPRGAPGMLSPRPFGLVRLIPWAASVPKTLARRKMASAPRRSRFIGIADYLFSGRVHLNCHPYARPPGGPSRDALSYRVSFATTRSHQLAEGGFGHAFSPAFRAGSLDPLGRVGAEDSG